MKINKQSFSLNKNYQSGFVIAPIMILIGLLLTAGVVTIAYKSKLTNQPVAQNTQEATSSANPQQSPTPSPKFTNPSPKATSKNTTPSLKPTPTPIPTLIPSPSPAQLPTSSPTPTPTPKPKPICSVTVVPSSNGNAPLETSICVGNSSNPYQAVQQELVDYDGEGNWNYQGAQYGCHSFTFQNPGTYYPKAKIIGSSGDESDTCQTTVTVN